jgi:predicted metal-dependent peptidase
MKSDELQNIVLAIDTSGSIDNEALSQFSAELSAILEYGNFEVNVIYCDSNIAGEETFQKADLPLKLNLKGGGGTDFRPVFKHVEQKGMQPAILIYFTDLECNRYPKQMPSYPVLWAVWGRGYEYNDTPPPFGEVARIE